jgi:aspartyl-tRNA(Asn)/glutamyl-tRNA(Gln) amidotransferase subunit C
MSIGKDEVLHVARLAEIAVSETELPRLVAQLSEIVDYVAQLDQVRAVDGDEAFLAGPARVALRPDEVRCVPLARSPAEMAPEFVDGFFVVPRHGAMEEG